MRHQIDQFDGSAIDTFCSESTLSNATEANQLPTLPKSLSGYVARGRYTDQALSTMEIIIFMQTYENHFDIYFEDLSKLIFHN